MKNAVIYPRFSSHGQNEQSIEGQIRICKEFAESKGFNIINIYPEKARTGTNDDRPAFQRMIKDAASGAFQYIIVYMFDRFARNRRDSIMYKELLKDKYGIRVLSALEPVADDEGGEFYEMFLEWNAEKYSKRLSKRVRDGLDTSVANGTFCGGYLIHGYKIAHEPIAGKAGKSIKRIKIDEEQAEIIRYVFKEYADGMEKVDIANALNAKGLNYKGKPFKGRTFDKWLSNQKYTGEFNFGDRVSNNMYPQIIDKILFGRVQRRLAENQYFSGGNSAKEPYLLQGKAMCGHCGTLMVAGGGTSHTGTRYYYYDCKKAKKKECNKKHEKKDFLEKYVVVRAIRYLKNPKRLARMADDLISFFEMRTGEDGLRSIETKIVNAKKEAAELTNIFIEAKSSLLRANIETKMSELEVLIKDLTLQKSMIELERGLKLTQQDIIDSVAELIDGDPNDKDFQKNIIDKLVGLVYVFDGMLTVFFNLGGNDVIKISLDELNETLDNMDELRDYNENSSSMLNTPLPPIRQN